MSEVKPTSLPITASEALAEARDIIAEANRRADRILQEAEEIRERAYQDGFLKGVEHGAVQVATSAIRRVENIGQVYDMLATLSAEIALTICPKLIAEFVAGNPESIIKLATVAFSHIPDAPQIKIKANPEDAEVLRVNQALIQELAGAAPVFVVEDSSISRGGCVIITELGEIDSRVEVLISQLRGRLGLSNS